MAIETDGFPITSLREIKILKELNHPNIVKLKEVVVGYKQHNIAICNISIFLVFEYAEADLANLIDYLHMEKDYLSLSEIKCIMLQILNAVAYLHQNNVLHRDLKFSNILINQKGLIKLADFGLARKIGKPLIQYTPKVVTLWYRSPEILLHTQPYSTPSDAWGVGCIFGELLNMGQPILPGSTEVHQFEKICNLIGRPHREIWPQFFVIPSAKKLIKLAKNDFNRLPETFSKYSKKCVSLLNGLLAWDPRKRMTVEEALLHDFFTEAPFPCQPYEIGCLIN